MSHRLTGKVAVITGSTSGIGLGLAQSLASEGANIMLNGLSLTLKFKHQTRLSGSVIQTAMQKE